jgi:o-succinylbenzoate synthase
MKIADFTLYSFTIGLVQPIIVKGVKLNERAGFIIKLADENGHCGFGEASPLPSFSFENLETVASQLHSLRYSMSGGDFPRDLEELSYGFARWLERFNLAPSVRFGFEAAVLNLIADSRNLPLRKIISDVYRDSVSVNGLLSGTRNEILSKTSRLRQDAYQAVKLKVGQHPLQEEIRLVHDVREWIGDGVTLRLDANCAWSIEDALIFLQGVSSCQIDYVEEPVRDFGLLVSLLNKTNLPMPIALDESLMELTPENFTPLPNLKAVVLKPTMLGFERSMQFARRALSLGIIPVVSSAFETGVGLTSLAELASVLNTTDVPVGLDTIDCFKEDLLRAPIQIEKGRISLPHSVVRSDQIRRELLQEVAHV